jgi:hypothetical protein
MIRLTEEFRALLKAARRAGTPLLAVRTADPTSAVAQVTASVGEQSGLLRWDLMTGIRGINKTGVEVITDRFGDNTMLGPTDVLAASRKLDNRDVVLFLSNAHRFWDERDVVQAIWNVRDPFKSGGQSLVLLSTPGAMLPAELQNDVIVNDEPLPAARELVELVGQPPGGKVSSSSQAASSPRMRLRQSAAPESSPCNAASAWER